MSKILMAIAVCLTLNTTAFALDQAQLAECAEPNLEQIFTEENPNILTGLNFAYGWLNSVGATNPQAAQTIAGASTQYVNSIIIAAVSCEEALSGYVGYFRNLGTVGYDQSVVQSEIVSSDASDEEKLEQLQSIVPKLVEAFIPMAQ